MDGTMSLEIIMFCIDYSCKEKLPVHLGTNPEVGAEIQTKDMQSPYIRRVGTKFLGSSLLTCRPVDPAIPLRALLSCHVKQ